MVTAFYCQKQITYGDFNGDGRSDIALIGTAYQVHVLLGRPQSDIPDAVIDLDTKLTSLSAIPPLPGKLSIWGD